MRDRVPDMEYVFCDTDKELKETYEYLDKLEHFLGKKIVRLRDDRGFDHWLQVYGGYLPSSRMRWCTRMLKIKPFEKYVGDDPVRERSEKIGALERGFSSPTRPLIIVVFRHSRRKGNDHAQVQTQPTATSREDPTATAGSPRESGQDPGRPAADRNQTPRSALIRTAKDFESLEATIAALTNRLSALLMAEATQVALDDPENRSQARSLAQGAGHTIKDQGRRDVTLRTTCGAGHRPGDLLQPQL